MPPKEECAARYPRPTPAASNARGATAEGRRKAGFVVTMAVDMASSGESVNGDCGPGGLPQGRDSPPAYAELVKSRKGFLTVGSRIPGRAVPA